MGEPRIPICLNALLLQNHLGGIGNYTYHLAKRLVASHPEWDIHLLVHRGVAGHFRDIQGLTLIEAGVVSRWARLLLLHLIYPFRASRFALFHSVGNMGLAFGGALQVITIHDTYEHASPERFSPAKRALMSFLIKVSGRKAARIITDSLNSGRDIAKYYPALSDKVIVVYLGNKFPVSRAALPEGRQGFIFVGTIEPGKNLPLVLDAFARFRRKHPGKLSVIGAMGWKQSELPGIIRDLGIGDSVEFLGYVPDEELMELYSRSLALIQASNYEGFGLPVIEAMACGCPVITSRNSGLVEAGGDSALFFETNDRDGLLARMEEIHDQPAVREKCIRTGFAHAATFSWDRTAEETAEVYARCLELRAGRVKGGN